MCPTFPLYIGHTFHQPHQFASYSPTNERKASSSSGPKTQRRSRPPTRNTERQPRKASACAPHLPIAISPTAFAFLTVTMPSRPLTLKAPFYMAFSSSSPIVSSIGILRKCLSRVNKTPPASNVEAAIQMSFVGIGVPFFFNRLYVFE